MKKILFSCIFLCICQCISCQIKVACIGNSITYGTGVSDRSRYSYPVQLQNMLGSQYLVENFGKPGATLLRKGHCPYNEQNEYRKALSFAADVALIHLGINDTDPRDWPNYRDNFVRDYLQLINSFRKANSKCRIIIAYLTPITSAHPRFISGTQLWHKQIQAAIKTVANASGAELIDFHSPLYAHPDMLPDAVHPNDEGAELLARTAYSAITGDYGGLHLPMLYTDNMILQRNIPLRIHGTANAGTPVEVCMAGQCLKTKAGSDGNWEVILSPLSAGTNYCLSISTPNQRKRFKNVAVGEVWLCSGQSNMQFMLSQSADASKDIPRADNPNIRLYNMKGRWDTNASMWSVQTIDSVAHLKFFKKVDWQVCTSRSVPSFSAVAYYFGKMLQDSLKVPIGLICNAVGGSTTESWIDRYSLESQFPAILNNWTQNDYIQDWVRERALLNLRNSKSVFKRHPYEPCYLYEAGIIPLERYPIRGVIWYQGESNAHNMDAHEALFSLLVKGWRDNWHQPDMPFYFVQLSSLNRPSWTWFRDSQLRLMRRIPFSGMAVSSDCGDSLDVHPRNKRPVGERLARWALNKTYHCTVLPSGPLFKKGIVKGRTVELSFDYSDGMHASDGKKLHSFELADQEGLFYPADAIVKDNLIILTSKDVIHPHYVRYAWQPYTRANLVNKDNLPASTFRAELQGRKE